MKYFNGLNMGEGIAGPDAVGAATTVIYSCMGIAFVNRERRFGRLYHYPSCAVQNGNVIGTIRQMANDIAPDEIVLTPAQSDGMTGGSSRDDIEDVRDLLASLCRQVTLAPARISAELFWRIDGPVFNRTPENGPEPKAVPERFRSTMSQGARELEANIWYYGGDGEQKDVLEQGLTVTRRSSRSTIL